MVVVYLPYKFIWQRLVPMLSPTFSSSGNFLSGEEGEKLGEVCILDNCQHDSRSTK